MDSQKQNPSSRAALVLIAFGLLCAGILVVLRTTTGGGDGSARSGDGNANAASAVTCPSEATREALRDTAQADVALRERNFGAAQVHIQRARVRLEDALAAMDQSAEQGE
ncbi:MAG: hypothetical protein ACOC1F_06430 [Myxococcota bacterium]